MQEEKAYFPQNRISPISLPMDAVRQLILDKVDNLAEIGGPRDFTLKKSEWPLCHVTVGSYKRR